MIIEDLDVTEISNETKSGNVRDVFTSFTMLDWFFVVLSYIWLQYLILRVGLLALRPNEFGFDFMPLVNGSAFIWIAWGGVRLNRRMTSFFRRLDEGAGVPFASIEERRACLAALFDLGRRFGRVAAAVVALSMLGGIVSFLGLFSGSRLDEAAGAFVGPEGRSVTFFNAAMMVAICVPTGSYAGYLIGQMLANGRLLDVLRQRGHDLSGFATDKATETLHAIEAIYAYATRATVGMTAVLAGWWVAFALNLPMVETYLDWRPVFAWLWVIALLAFVFSSLRPVLAFRHRLEEVYGGPSGLALARAQISLAQADLAALKRRRVEAVDGRAARRLERRIDDLAAFVATLRARTLRRPILQRSFLLFWLVLNGLAFALPLALGRVTDLGGRTAASLSTPTSR